MVSLNIALTYQFLLTFLTHFFVLVVSLFIATRLINNIVELSYRKGLYQSNLAISIYVFGYYSAIILVLVSALSLKNENFDIITNLLAFSSLVILGMIFLSIDQKIFNYLYLNSLDSQFELERENLSLSLIQTGGLLSFAILFYSIFNETEFYFKYILNDVVILITSQIILFTVIKIAFFKSRFDEVREIQKGNVAVSIELTSIFISFAFLIGNIAGDIQDIDANGFSKLILLTAISFIPLMYLPSLLTSFIVSENKKADSSIEDGNIVIAIKSGIVRIAVAILLIETLPYNILIFNN